MTILTINFSKMLIEKTGTPPGAVRINNNINIADVKESDISFGKASQKAIIFKFEFTSKYDPEIGNILIEGNTVYMGDDKVMKTVLEGWKKNKEVPQEVMSEVLNNVLSKCNVQAIILSRDIQLPPPIPMPKVRDTPAAPKKKK